MKKRRKMKPVYAWVLYDAEDEVIGSRIYFSKSEAKTGRDWAWYQIVRVKIAEAVAKA
jgi:hypothetical protein